VQNNPPRYYIEQVLGTDLLSVRFEKEQQIYFLSMAMGLQIATMTLPEVMLDWSDDLHITSHRIGYQLVYPRGENNKRRLLGGSIGNNFQEWKTTFETETPRGSFKKLSTHCGFHDEFKHTLVLYAPTGHFATLTECIKVFANKKTLFTIESIPNRTDSCLLVLRNLLDNHSTAVSTSSVVSEATKTIELPVQRASFGKLCQNDQYLVLFADAYHGSPIFVDLVRGTVVQSHHSIQSYGSYVVNTEGDIWTWDPVTKQIWKITIADHSRAILMGTLESGRGTSFLHAEGDVLYFVDIPF